MSQNVLTMQDLTSKDEAFHELWLGMNLNLSQELKQSSLY